MPQISWCICKVWSETSLSKVLGYPWKAQKSEWLVWSVFSGVQTGKSVCCAHIIQVLSCLGSVPLICFRADIERKKEDLRTMVGWVLLYVGVGIPWGLYCQDSHCPREFDRWPWHRGGTLNVSARKSQKKLCLNFRHIQGIFDTKLCHMSRELDPNFSKLSNSLW